MCVGRGVCTLCRWKGCECVHVCRKSVYICVVHVSDQCECVHVCRWEGVSCVHACGKE